MQNEDRLERIETHLRLMKESNEVTNIQISKITNALIGNEYNNSLGLVNEIQKTKSDVQSNREDILILKDNMALVKWFGAAAFGAIVSIIIYIIEK